MKIKEFFKVFVLLEM